MIKLVENLLKPGTGLLDVIDFKERIFIKFSILRRLAIVFNILKEKTDLSSIRKLFPNRDGKFQFLLKSLKLNSYNVTLDELF